MKKTTLLVSAGLLALAGGLATAPVASATAPPPTLKASPSTVLAGQTLEFSATCYGNASQVSSPGLAAPVTLSDGAGHGKAGARPGHYTASFTCSGSGGPAGNGTATAEFTIVCSLPTTKPTPPKTTTTTAAPETTRSEPPTSSPEATTAADTRCLQPANPARPPQVKVRPHGAPETGDGSTVLG
jgi:hypothetical protein